ncbi:hypothetical protein NPIL_167771 [Nephila pilipes]|uniref:Uncharacterized protein n=1 Tax=Nephila pilipes TaxID=299642 RepID=A0A8X6QUX5_NEPPI|nr:hypothetical protein NPIL_167771 [Nephila pilipes]
MKLLAWLRLKLCNGCGRKQAKQETSFEPAEEFEILPSISGYPYIIYPKFPEDDIEEPKTNGASYERQLSWALKESAEMAGNRGHFQKNKGIVILN